MGDELVPGCMSLFTLGCRNGLSVCGDGDAMIVLSCSLLARWYEHVSNSCEQDDLLSGFAIGALHSLAAFETIPKVPSDRRTVLENVFVKHMKLNMATIDSALSVQHVASSSATAWPALSGALPSPSIHTTKSSRYPIQYYKYR